MKSTLIIAGLLLIGLNTATALSVSITNTSNSPFTNPNNSSGPTLILGETTNNNFQNLVNFCDTISPEQSCSTPNIGNSNAAMILLAVSNKKFCSVEFQQGGSYTQYDQGPTPKYSDNACSVLTTGPDTYSVTLN